jgi:peptide/nickel transport system permease protein
MLRLIVLRVAMSAASLVLAAAFAFSLVHLSPTDPAVLALGDGASAAQKLALTRQLGLDQPILVQIWRWMTELLGGNLGQSIFAQKPVRDMIVEALPVTLSLLAGASLLAVAIGLGIGAVAGLRPGTWVDRMVTLGVSGALAMPSFWLALLLSFLFAVKLRLVPVAGYTGLTEDPARWALGLLLPCFALSVHGAAVLARHMRGAIIDVMESTFVNAARARGTPPTRIVWR